MKMENKTKAKFMNESQGMNTINKKLEKLSAVHYSE